jgi:hypothetical protein
LFRWPLTSVVALVVLLGSWLVGWYVGCLVWFVSIGWLVSSVGRFRWLVGLVWFGWVGDFVGWLASCLVCLVG